MISGKVGSKVVIEFFSPSGAGKSTFEHYLLQATDLEVPFRPWEAVAQSRYRFPRKVSSTVAESHRILIEKFASNLMKKDVDERDKEWLPGFVEQVIDEDLRVRKSSARGVFLRGDGIFHNLGAELLEIPEENVQALAEGRLFIRFGGPTNIICQRVQKREQEGDYRPQYRGRSFDEIVHVLEQAARRSFRLDELLSGMGHRVLFLDVRDPLGVSASRLQDFVLDSVEPSTR